MRNSAERHESNPKQQGENGSCVDLGHRFALSTITHNPSWPPEPHSGKICSAVDLNHQFIGSCVYDHDIGRSFRSFDFSGDRNSVADIIEPVVQDIVDADFKGTFDELRRRFCVHELR